MSDKDRYADQAEVLEKVMPQNVIKLKAELKGLLEKSANAMISDRECRRLLAILKAFKKDFASYCFEMLPNGINSGGVEIGWRDFHIK